MTEDYALPQQPGRSRYRPLPGWPRVLGEAWAAAYVGLSPSAFRRGPANELPPPILLTKQRKGWLRDDLDAWIDRKAGRVEVAEHSSWDSLHDSPDPTDFTAVHRRRRRSKKA